MIWNILRGKKHTVFLPRKLNTEELYGFVNSVVDEHADSRYSEVVFNFSRLEFIEPTGAVVLCNLIEYLTSLPISVKFADHAVMEGTANHRKTLKYLDDSQFFSRYLGKPVFAGCAVRENTVGLHLIERSQAHGFLSNRLIPWVALRAGVQAVYLQSMYANLIEIFHNIADHSDAPIGCAFAQYFPQHSDIQIAVSDFGIGIPDRVRTVLAGVSDVEALRQAAVEGFTTKTNVQNRGAGLHNLIRFTTNVGGNVLIASGKARLNASPLGPGRHKVTVKAGEEVYPGTLVRVILREHTLRKIIDDTVGEDFTW